MDILSRRIALSLCKFGVAGAIALPAAARVLCLSPLFLEHLCNVLFIACRYRLDCTLWRGALPPAKAHPARFLRLKHLLLCSLLAFSLRLLSYDLAEKAAWRGLCLSLCRIFSYAPTGVGAARCGCARSGAKHLFSAARWRTPAAWRNTVHGHRDLPCYVSLPLVLHLRCSACLLTPLNAGCGAALIMRRAAGCAGLACRRRRGAKTSVCALPCGGGCRLPAFLSLDLYSSSAFALLLPASACGRSSWVGKVAACSQTGGYGADGRWCCGAGVRPGRGGDGLALAVHATCALFCVCSMERCPAYRAITSASRGVGTAHWRRWTLPLLQHTLPPLPPSGRTTCILATGMK